MTNTRKQTDRDRPRPTTRRLDHGAGERDRTHGQRPGRADGPAGLAVAAESDRETARAGDDRADALSRVGELLAAEAGRPLPGETHREMAARFGTDFTGVRLHTGRRATETATTLDAAAYTVGDDIVLGTDVDMESPRGQWLLAHELAHVVQNSGGGRPSELVSPGADTPGEREASAAATDVLAGIPVQTLARPPAVIATAGPGWEDMPEFMGHWANSVGAQTAGLDWIGRAGKAANAGDDIASPVARLLSRSSNFGRFSNVAQSGSKAFSRLGNVAGVLGMGLGGYNAVAGDSASDRYQGGADFLASGAGVFGGPVGGAFSGGYAAGQVLDAGVGAFRDDGRKLSDIGGDALYDAVGPASPGFLDFYDNPLDTTTGYVGEKFDDLMDLF